MIRAGKIKHSSLDNLFILNERQLSLSDIYIYQLYKTKKISLEKAHSLKNEKINNLLELNRLKSINYNFINYNKGYEENSLEISRKILEAINESNYKKILLISEIIKLSATRIKFNSEPHIGQFQQFLGLLYHYSKKNKDLEEISLKLIELYNKSDIKVLSIFEYNDKIT